jgi:GPI mannosyltransferase 4
MSRQAAAPAARALRRRIVKTKEALTVSQGAPSDNARSGWLAYAHAHAHVLRSPWLASTLLGLALWPGYIHPDEWLQSAEIAVRLLTPYATRVPWEFQLDDSGGARSVVVPLLAAGPPVSLWHLLDLSPTALAVLIRVYLSLTLGTLCIRAVSKAARACGSAPPGSAFALSWPAVVLLQRPLSNSLEAGALAATMLLVLDARTQQHAMALSTARLLHLGATLGIAVFCRFTAILYLAPLVTFALLRARASGRLIRSTFALACGLLAAAIPCFIADSLWFGRPVLTPWRSLLYNARSDNLAKHGIHPRILHVAVNLPLLALPLIYPALAKIESARDGVTLALGATVALPLAVLSLAPHQEPRFLLPMLLPLAALGGHTASTRYKRLFVAFNLAAALFFGGLHQAGVLPAISRVVRHVAMHRTASSSCVPHTQLLFWRTYSVPLSLFRLPDDGTFTFVDLGAVPRNELDNQLSRMSCLSACSTRVLVMPGWAAPPAGAQPMGSPIFPHISTEDFGDMVEAAQGQRWTRVWRRAFSLVVFELPCDNHASL